MDETGSGPAGSEDSRTGSVSPWRTVALTTLHRRVSRNNLHSTRCVPLFLSCAVFLSQIPRHLKTRAGRAGAAERGGSPTGASGKLKRNHMPP